MDNIFANPDALRVLATISAGFVILAFGALLTLLGVKLSVKQWQQVRFYWTQYYPTIRAQVDQPTDAGPMAFDKIMDKLLAADWNVLLSAFGTALVDTINKRVEVRETIKPA